VVPRCSLRSAARPPNQAARKTWSTPSSGSPACWTTSPA
jgi:hypothetical protein